MKRICFLMSILLIISVAEAQQPTLLWQFPTTDNGFVASPLLTDMYYAPQFPGASFVGEEIFVASILDVSGGINSTLFGLKKNGSVAVITGFSGQVIRSSAAGAQLLPDNAPQIVFGSSEGVYIVSNAGTPYFIPIPEGVSATPAIANLDNDQWPEIVIYSDNSTIYVYKWNGTSAYLINNFPVSINQESSMLSPAVGNINNESRNEIVVATSTGRVYAYNYMGTLLSGNWPATLSSTISVSPTIGKVDTFTDQSKNVVIADDSGKVYLLRYNGNGLMNWPKQMGGLPESSPIIVDLDMDQDLEVIICASDSMVYAWHGNGNAVSGWPVDLRQTIQAHSRGALKTQRAPTLFADPVVADIDSDMNIEIIVPVTNDAMFIALEANGTVKQNGWPFVLGSGTNENLVTSPAISDINNDGYLEMVIGTFADFSSTASVYCVKLGSDPGLSALKPWPMYRQNRQRTGASLIVSGGYAPICNFNSVYTFAPGDVLTLNYTQYVVDYDSSPSNWSCYLTGNSNLQVSHTSNTVFTVESTNWAGIETLTVRVVDGGGLSCTDNINVICGIKGDLNKDRNVTLADVGLLTTFVLGASCDNYQAWAGDLNDDSELNIRDLIAIIGLL